MKTVGEPDYAYAVANIRANEHKLLSKADFRGMISASSADDIIRMLKERGFGAPTNAHTDDELIELQNEKIFSYINELSEGNEIFNSFLMKNDFHNLKVLIKAKLADVQSAEMLLSPSLIKHEEIETCVNRNDFSPLPEWIRQTAEFAFKTAAETKDGQLCDIIIDKAMMEAMKESAKKSKNEFMLGLTEKQIELSDIKIAMRSCKAKKDKSFVLNALIECKEFDIRELAAASENADTLINFLTEKGFEEAAAAFRGNNISAFERYADDKIISYIDAVKHSVFGIEPLIAYLIYNETEQKNLRIILAGKRAGVNENMIAERMRESYA